MTSPHRPIGISMLALLAAAAVSCGKQDGQLLHVASPAWEDQVVYFVMTDRFANGDPSNDDQKKGEFDPTNKDKYSGGDLQGVIDKLDYIQGLGATAVWITPPVANMWWDPLQQSGGFHGYWARHLKKVDEHLGTLDTYKALSSALHKRGMYLIQDVVPNHMGNFFTYSAYNPNNVASGFVKNLNAVPRSKPEQSPFDQNDATDPAQQAAAIYHWTPTITNYADPYQTLFYQVSDLDDLNSENPLTRSALRDSYGYWIKEVGVDAFRVDTVKYVPHAFWNDFFYSTDATAPGINAVARSTGRNRFHAFGEVFETSDPLTDTADQKLAAYNGTAAAPELPALLEFPLYAEIGRVFAGGKPTSYMTYRLQKFMDPTLYPNPNVTPTFIDNHDVRRFLSISTQNGLLQALAFLFTVPGIPTLYYGTEQLFTETRAAMFGAGYLGGGKDHFDTTAAFYQQIRKLADLRKSSRTFTQGGLDVLSDSSAGAGPLAYRRTLNGDTVLVLMNTADESVLIDAMNTQLAAGASLDVLLSLQNAPAPTVGAGGLMTVVLPPRAVVVAHANGQVVAPPAPAATIVVNTAIDGQTFSNDVTLTGTVSPATTRLKMVLDGYVDRASAVTVASNGSWSIVLPVSTFPTGLQSHTLAFYAPDAKVASPLAHFNTNVVFNGTIINVPDPVGDDKGPKGTYTYPKDATFGHQNDITNVTLEVGATTMNIKITMADWSTVWNPPNGFDHVAFSIYFSLPGQTGATSVMPKLQANTPAGFAWTYNQFTYGWDNVMYTSNGATASSYGTVATAPSVAASSGTRTVAFTYDRTKFGLATWSGVKVYVTTWDFDGIGAAFRQLTDVGYQWKYGGGGPPYTTDTSSQPPVNVSADPMIMDDVPPISIP